MYRNNFKLLYEDASGVVASCGHDGGGLAQCGTQESSALCTAEGRRWGRGRAWRVGSVGEGGVGAGASGGVGGVARWGQRGRGGVRPGTPRKNGVSSITEH